MTKLVKNLIIGGSATTVLAGGGTGIALALSGKKSSNSNNAVVARTANVNTQVQSQLDKIKGELETAKTPADLLKIENELKEISNNPDLSNSQKELINNLKTGEKFVENLINTPNLNTYAGFHNALALEKETKELEQEAQDRKQKQDRENEERHQEDVDHKREQDLNKLEAHHETLHIEHELALERHNSLEEKKTFEQHSKEISSQAHKLFELEHAKEVLSQNVQKIAEDTHKANLENLAKVENEVKAWVNNQNNQHSKEISNQAHQLFVEAELTARAQNLVDAISQGQKDQEAVLARLALDHSKTIEEGTNLVNAATMDAIRKASEKLATEEFTKAVEASKQAAHFAALEAKKAQVAALHAKKAQGIAKELEANRQAQINLDNLAKVENEVKTWVDNQNNQHSKEISNQAHQLFVDSHVKQVQEIMSGQLTKAVEMHQTDLENLAKVENEVKTWVDNQNNQHSKEISNQAHQLFVDSHVKQVQEIMSGQLTKAVEIHQTNLDNLARVENEIKTWVDNENKLFKDREREILSAFNKVPTVSISPDLLSKLISGTQTFTNAQINNLPLPKELVTSLTDKWGVVKVEVNKNGNGLIFHLFDKNGIELTKEPIHTGMNVVNPRPELAQSVHVLTGHQTSSNQVAATKVTDTKLFIGSEIIAKFAQNAHAYPATVVQDVVKEIESQIGGTEHHGEIYAPATTTMAQLEVDTATAIDHNQAEEIARLIGLQEQEVRKYLESQGMGSRFEEFRSALDGAKQIFTMFAARQKFEAIQKFASSNQNLLFSHWRGGASLPTQYASIIDGNFMDTYHLSAVPGLASAIRSQVQGQVWVKFETTASGLKNVFIQFDQGGIKFEFKIENVKINEVSNKPFDAPRW